MRDSRLFDSVVGYAPDEDDAPQADGRGGKTEDPWLLAELESREQSPDPRLGQVLGTIRLEGLVGQGGMGTVFEGWDEKLQRKVAVKAVSHRYRDDSKARKRFLREARLLSKLQHPNICQIHDHIEGEDGDYLVLELVRGRSLRSMLEAGETFTQTEGLGFARQLVAALVAAHDQGVAHRDLKPANIMVTPDGTVKVLDFGLGLSVEQAVEKGSAKAGLEWSESGSIRRPDLDELRQHAEGVTAVGGRHDTRSYSAQGSGSIEGTLAYMSPEQAKSQDAGTASDIYSLGLVLQEVFTGAGAYPADLPITNQLVRAGQGDTLPVTGVDADLARLVERMKALAPGSRPSAPDVADRLRWIAGKPARRLRAIALGAFIAMLVVFSAVMAYQRSRIAEEAARANREAESSRQVTEYLQGVFEVADPWTAESGDVSAREVLRQGTEKIRSELQDQPLIRARLLTTLGEVTRRLGDFDEARPLLQESLALQRELDAEPRDLVSTMTSMAHIQSDVGDFEPAAEGFREAIAIQREFLGHKSLELADNLLNLGGCERQLGNLETAEDLYRQALAIYEKDAGGPDTLDAAKALSQLAILMSTEDRFDEAEEYHLRVLEIREALLPPKHPDLGTTYYNLASHYQRRGKYRDAWPLFRRDLELSLERLGPDHPNVAFGHRYLAANLVQLGRLEEAERHARRALTIHREIYPDDSIQIPISLEVLGKVRRAQGDAQEALDLFAEAARRDRELGGDQDIGLAADLLSLGSALYDLRRLEEAAERQREALEIRIGRLGADDLETIEARLRLARTLLATSQIDESERQYRQASTALEDLLAEKPADFLTRHALSQALAGLARVAAKSGDARSSEEHLSRSLEILESLADAELLRLDSDRVEILVELGRLDEAAAVARWLSATGYARQDFVDLCQEHGWAI